MLKHLHNYPLDKEQVDAMVEVVKQAATIFEFGSAFSYGLVKAICKDQYWNIIGWSKTAVDELVASLKRQFRIMTF